jgi:hypothetical protein
MAEQLRIMRVIKLGLISIVFFFLLITGISLFFPSHIRISKAINIGTGRDSLFSNIAGIQKWKNWYPGFDTLPLLDPMIIDGNIVAAKTKGISITLTTISDSLVVAEFRDNSGKPIMQSWKTFPHPAGDSVILQSYMDFYLRWYPWEKFSSLLFEKRYAPQIEQGLTNLKNFLEK